MSPLPMILLLLAQSQAPAPLAGTAVDHQGPMIEAEIVLAQGQAPDGSVPILARATTDIEGHYAIAASSPDWRPSEFTPPCLFSYRPGSGLIASVTTMGTGDPSAFQLTSLAPVRRTFTLRGGDGRPMADVRLAPVSVRPSQPHYFAVMIPDALVGRMEVTTGPDGRAVLDSLASTTELMAVRVTVPGRGIQTLALAEGDIAAQAVSLELRAAGGLAGRVVRPDGRPAAGTAVEVWSRSGRRAPLAPVRFDAGPIRTDDDGRFRTPPGLLAGVKYRGLIRADGFKPVLSEWVAPPDRSDGSVELAEIVLAPPRSLAGRVVDRQSRPVAGAEVIAGGEGIATTVDGRGTFRLEGLTATRTLLVVRRDGFRIDGRVIGEADREVEFVLARFDEPARRPMTTMPGPLPMEERRRLARRVLEPFLTKVLAKGGDSAKAWALRALMVSDPQAALDGLGRTTFLDPRYYESFLKREIVPHLARQDEAAASAVAETIPEAYRRAEALVDVCTGLPDDRRDRKRALADRVLAAARAEPQAKYKVWQLGEAAELLLDLGETERSKAIFAEGLPIAQKLGPADNPVLGYFASRLGRVDLPSALALIDNGDRAEDLLAIGNLALRIAASHPAEAERLAEKVRGLPRGGGSVLRTCQNMAATDLSRARRLAMSIDQPGLRSAALIFAACGLPPSERKAPRDLIFRQALRDIDQARKTGARDWSSTAALMPLVESIDASLVPEFFWRTVANLAVANDPRAEYGRSGVLGEAILLARYDREVATVLLEPATRASAAKGRDSGQMTPSEVVLLAVINPHRAVAVVEAMPEAANLEPDGANWSRIVLAQALGGDDASLWKWIWGTWSGLGGILGRRDVLF